MHAYIRMCKCKRHPPPLPSLSLLFPFGVCTSASRHAHMPHKRAALHQVLALITVCRVWTESDANDEGKRVGVCCRVLCAAKRTTCSGAGHFAMVLTSVLVQARAHSSSAVVYCISLPHLCTVCLCTKATVRAMAVMESELHLLPLAFFLPLMLLLLLGGGGGCVSLHRLYRGRLFPH